MERHEIIGFARWLSNNEDINESARRELALTINNIKRKIDLVNKIPLCEKPDLEERRNTMVYVRVLIERLEKDLGEMQEMYPGCLENYIQSKLQTGNVKMTYYDLNAHAIAINFYDHSGISLLLSEIENEGMKEFFYHEYINELYEFSDETKVPRIIGEKLDYYKYELTLEIFIMQGKNQYGDEKIFYKKKYNDRNERKKLFLKLTTS